MKYLVEAPFEEAMTVWLREDKKPLVHTIWTGDFMGMCKHDVPCMVCWEASAIIERNVTPGRYSQSIQPCDACQEAGWSVTKRASWWAFWRPTTPSTKQKD